MRWYQDRCGQVQVDRGLGYAPIPLGVSMAMMAPTVATQAVAAQPTPGVAPGGAEDLFGCMVCRTTGDCPRGQVCVPGRGGNCCQSPVHPTFAPQGAECGNDQTCKACKQGGGFVVDLLHKGKIVKRSCATAAGIVVRQWVP